MSHLNHIHMIATVVVNNPPSIEKNNRWLDELVVVAGMQKFFEPISKRSDEIDNKGVTGCVGLTCSHATSHFFEPNDGVRNTVLKFDIYSCSQFSIDKIIAHFREFDPVSIDYMIIDRNGRNKVIDQKFIVLK